MDEGGGKNVPNILVIGGEGSGKSSLIRLLLGKQSIGESRDFYLHTGLMGHNNRLVKILECPPRRQELLEQYSERLREAVRGFSGPVTCVLVVIKQAIMSGTGFALNRERNIPLDELRAAYSVMGNRFKTSIHVVFSNWSRQFARLNDRLKRGITEETAQNKIATEFQRNLNITKITCYFMDTVFWRNEQRNADKGAMTTLQSSYSLAGAIFQEPYDPVSDTSTPKVGSKFTSKKPPSAPPKHQYQDHSDSSSSGSDSEVGSVGRLNKWKGKKMSNLATSNGHLDKPVNNDTNLGVSSRTIPIERESFHPETDDVHVVRAVPAKVVESPTSNKPFTKYNINEFVESKVKEMMRDEGVVLDFTEAKLNGKIITKTKIIKEIIGKDGQIEYVEEEEVDESPFGPALDNINTSMSSETSSRIQREIMDSSKPIDNLGSPVVSTTFDRRNKLYRSSYTQYENYQPSTGSVSSSSDESDADQVIVAEKTPKYEEQTKFNFDIKSASSPNIPHVNIDSSNNFGGTRTISNTFVPVSREEFSSNYNVQSFSSSHVTQKREEHSYSHSYGSQHRREDYQHGGRVSHYNDQARGKERETVSHYNDQVRGEERETVSHYNDQVRGKERETVSHYNDQVRGESHDADRQREESFRTYDWRHKGEAQTNKDIVIEHIRKSESPRSSVSTDMTEAIDFALNQITINNTSSQASQKRLDKYPSKFVLLGNQDTMNAMWNTLRRQGVKEEDFLTCPISPEGDMLQYEDLLRSLTVGDQVVFVWAIKTQSGNVDDDLIMVFKDFLDIFAADAIKSMAVVLWYPGSIEEIQGSIEDLTERVKKKYHYDSPLGFPILQYTPDAQFEAKVVEAMLGMQPFKITNITLSMPEPLPDPGVTNTLRDEGMRQEKRSIAKSQEIVVVSTEHVTENIQDRGEERMDEETFVETPVVLVVGAPGHGKSSVGNLILGGDNFDIRGTNVMESQSIVKSGYLVRNEAYTTVLDAPGFCKDGLDRSARRKVETEIRKIGYLTHIVIVWHALELRDEDLDVVLAEVVRLFGEQAIEHIIFTVTYCDTGSKAKKYRSKRGISYDSISAMITRKAKNVFNSEEKPLIYFVCSKQYKDQSRKHLIQYLNYDQWKMLPANKMANWTDDSELNPNHEEDDNYAEVEEEVFFPDNSLPSGSKSLHNLSTLPSSNNLSRDNDNFSKSLHTVHDEDIPQDNKQGRGGRGRLFSSNVGKKGSTSGSNVGKRTLPGRASRGKGRSRSQSNLFGGPSRSRSNSRANLERKEESVQNVYQESSITNGDDVNDRTLTRDRSSSRKRNPSRSGLFGTRTRSRSRSNVRKSRTNLADQESRLDIDETRGESNRDVQASNDGDDRDGTLTRGQYSRQRSGGSVTSSVARRRGRSKSRERTRQSRSQLSRGRQSTSLPRPQQEAGDRRPPMRRSRSNWSLKSSGNRSRARRDGDCTIL